MNLILLLIQCAFAVGDIVLLTQLHAEENKARFSEILEALKLNIENKYIDEIHLLQFDNVTIPHSKKVYVKPTVNSRLTFNEALHYANNHLLGNIVIIANNDISFDESLKYLVNPHINRMLTAEYNCFCLSRHEPDNMDIGIGTQCGPKYMGSHDAFIFSPPVPASLLNSLPADDVYLGQIGTDARFIYEARRAGLLVSNPCKSIKIWHHHKSAWRTRQPGAEANLRGKSDVAFPEAFPFDAVEEFDL